MKLRTFFEKIKSFLKLFDNRKKTIIVDEVLAAQIENEKFEEKNKKSHPWWDLRYLKFNSCLTLGVISNVFFFIFIIICLYYYDLFQMYGDVVVGFEIAGYTMEALGFLFMAASIFGIVFRVVERSFAKVLMIIYLIIEVGIMTLEFQFFSASWYHPFSKLLIIGHAVFSAIVCYSYISLDPFSKGVRRAVYLASLICLAGMIWVIFGYKIYLSLLTNCLAYLLLFLLMKLEIYNDNMDVQCYGDPAKVVETKSVFFE